MEFTEFSIINRNRCESLDGFAHALASWSTSDWMTAVMVEICEAANIVKKLNQVRDGVPGNDKTEVELRHALGDEIADTFIYLDLLAQSLGFDLESLVVGKFNRTSKKIGYPTMIYDPDEFLGD